MQGDKQVISFLNKVLGNELIAINQYFLHAKMFEDWGLKELADFTRHESIDEMKHADEIIERILFLEGLPNLQDLGKLHIGEDTEEMLNCDLGLEMKAIPDLRDAIAYSEEVRDFVSRDLFQKILDDEEAHVDWLETQLSLIEKMGIQNYLAEKMDKE
jgi:bacterioferritin